MQRWRLVLLEYARWWRNRSNLLDVFKTRRTLEQAAWISREDVVSGTDERADDGRAGVLESLAWDGVDVRG